MRRTDHKPPQNNHLDVIEGNLTRAAGLLEQSRREVERLRDLLKDDLTRGALAHRWTSSAGVVDVTPARP